MVKFNELRKSLADLEDARVVNLSERDSILNRIEQLEDEQEVKNE